MSKLYDIVILGGDDPGSWLAAGAFASKDMRVALILDRSPDPGLAQFPWLPLDLSRYPGLLSEFGLRPQSSPTPIYRPDFQVIVAGKTIDIIADPDSFKRNLKRDLGGKDAAFLNFSRELDRLADEFRDAEENSDSMQSLFKRDKHPWRKWFKKDRKEQPPAPAFSEWARAADPLFGTVALAASKAVLGAPLPPGVSLPQVSLLWSFCTALHRGPGAGLPLREQAAEKIAKRGVVMEAEPEALIKRGKVLHSIRLKGGVIIDTRILLTRKKVLSEFLGGEHENGDTTGKTGRRSGRTTFFFTIKKSTAPESMAARAIVIHDPDKPLSGDNLMTIVLSPRVPRRDTLAVTLPAADTEPDPEMIPEKLASSMPWLDPGAITVDDTRPPLISPYRDGNIGLNPAEHLAPGIENLLPLPSEPLPGWGPAGIEVALRRLVAHCDELIAKYKNKMI
jgi:hypothetical protein